MEGKKGKIKLKRKKSKNQNSCINVVLVCIAYTSTVYRKNPTEKN